ncbi:MAG: choice-of-anchor I family protein [Haloferacaceae archaeon]
MSGRASADVETVRMERVGRYATGEALGGAEIVSFDAERDQLFVVNSGAGQVEVLDLADPTAPTQTAVLNASDLVADASAPISAVGGTNSVDVRGDVVAAAIEADPATDDGVVALYDAASLDLIQAVGVGPLPDKVTISPDGGYVVVANEGEPGENADPAGSVSVVDIGGNPAAPTVSTASFTAFDGQEDALRAEGVHLVAPGDGDVTASAVIEPEFVSVSPDSSTAFVTLQENNAVARVDLAEATVTSVDGLGFKDFSLPGNELDTSDADGPSLQSWPLLGMFQPDAIDTYEIAGQTFVVTANEGDAKDFEVGVLGDLRLDPNGFDLSGNPYVDSVGQLQRPENLGTLEVNRAAMAEFADENDDGRYTDIYAIGGRSFSVWTPGEDGLTLVYDSGNDFEQTFIRERPAGHLNVTESGPETESIEIGQVGGRTFAFVGQEAGSGIAVYDVTNPGSPQYLQMAINRDYSVTEDDLAAAAEQNPDSDTPARAGDFAPEGVTFVSAADSPVANPLLCVGYELSGTVGVFEITPERGD